MNESITVALILLFLLWVSLAVIASRYMSLIYKNSKIHSWFFSAVVKSNWLKAVCGVIVGYLALRGLLITYNLPAPPGLPQGWASPVLIIVAAALVSSPIYYASIIYRARRRASQELGHQLVKEIQEEADRIQKGIE